VQTGLVGITEETHDREHDRIWRRQRQREGDALRVEIPFAYNKRFFKATSSS